MNKNEKRQIERYEISEYIKEDPYKDIFLEINSEQKYNPRVTDISMNGLGYAIEENESINLDEFDKLENFFISINFVNKKILVEVKKIWSIIIKKAEKKILKGGLVFSVISPEDRITIAEYINTIRS